MKADSQTLYEPFRFKEFELQHRVSAMKVGVDGILLGAWVAVDHAGSLLDVGTGCGLIAMMMAQRNQEAQIVAVEIDGPTAEEAAQNVSSGPWASRMEVVKGSIQDFAKSCNQKFEGIVSNPPFFTGGTLSTNLDRQAVRHTTKLSHHDLLDAVRKLLSNQGQFTLILPYLEGLRFKEVAQEYGFFLHRRAKVHGAVLRPAERLLMAFGRWEVPIREEVIVLRNEEGQYSQQFQELTSGFYHT